MGFRKNIRSFREQSYTNKKIALLLDSLGSAASGYAPDTATYLLQVADASLPSAQAMGALATGLVKNTTATGVQSIAVAGTDYSAPGHTHVATDVTDFTEAAQDAVGAMVDGSLTYVDGTPLLQRAALTGDVTASAGSNATTLATVNASPGTFGSATQVAQVTVNAKGLSTTVANVSIQIAESQVTNLTTDLAAKQPLDATLTSLAVDGAQGDILYADAASTFARLAKNTTATRYLSNTGATNNPAWAQVDLSNGVTGDLPFANLTQGSARSVLGVAGNSTADVASIQGTGNQVLVVNNFGTSLGFGQVNLASTNAVTGQLVAGSFPALTGDVTTAGGALATTIANNAVTYAKIQAVTASRLLGNDASGTACEELSLGQGLEFGSGTVAGKDATTAVKGVASFSSTDFTTSSGAVSLKKSGHVIGIVHRSMPPASSFAQEYARSGGSTPVETLVVWAFDPATIEYMDFLVTLSPDYAGGGIDVVLEVMSNGTSTVTRFGVAIRTLDDDIDGAGTFSFTDVDITLSATAGISVQGTVTGVAMDSWTAGKRAIVRVRRNASHANDTENTNDVWLIAPPLIKET